MELMEMAKLVGLAIKESEEGKRAEEMKKAYEEDEKIVALTTEFDVQQKALAAMVGNENADNNLTEAIQARLSVIYEEVLATEVYKAYEAAQKDLGRLIDKVNSVIMGQVSGNVEGCTHDCSSCSGCH